MNKEFESFYQSLLLDISTILEERTARIKTQFPSKILFDIDKQKKSLSINKGIVILKQDKGRGVVILNRSKHIEKCLSIVNISQFLQVDTDPTASIERKAQRILRKMKNKIQAFFYSNIRTATYALAKYLAEILKPLGQSQYTIKSSKSFIKTLKKQKIPPGFQMVSFDVVSLFTNVPLEEEIHIIIKRIYDQNEINTNIQKQEK